MALEKVATPNTKTIDALAAYLSVATQKTAKAVFLVATVLEGSEKVERFVFVIVRGDMEVSETKLANALHAVALRPAMEDEIRAVDAVPGYASPVGLHGVFTVVDDLIPSSPNLVSGANIEGYHLRNVNYPRDFQVDMMLDITLAKPGHGCPKCGKKLASTRGIELGHVFKLGTIFSEKLGATFLDPEGKQQPAIMGCYGIGIGRLLAAIIECNHDDKGIIWPLPIAPYHVYLCPLKTDDKSVTQAAEKIYEDLTQAGIEVLFDDRDESPGVKFNDADLIGIPLRIVVSPRTLKDNAVEVKWRKDKQAWTLPLTGLTEAVKNVVCTGGTC